MNQNLHSPTKLTEFAREFDDEPETIFTKFVNKITNAYNNNYNNINIIPPLNISAPTSPSGVPSSSSSSLPSTINNNSRDDSNCKSNSISPVLLNSSTQSTSGKIFSESNDDYNLRSSSLNNLIQSEDSSEGKNEQQNLDNSSNSGDSTNKSEAMAENVTDRTPLSVLSRISNIVAIRSNNLHSYKDTELQKFWMPDSKSKECYECSVKFSTFRRKHHCRLCGQIFCSKCCNQVVPGKIIKCTDNLKVCTYCSKIVLSYLKSTDLNTDLKSDLQALKEDLSNKLSGSSDSLNSIPDRRTQMATDKKLTIGYREERLASIATIGLSNADRKNILQQSNSLKLLHEEMFKVLPNQNRGLDLINFLITNQKSSNKIQAIAILNAMIDAGFVIPLIQSPSEPTVACDFDELCLYKLLRKDNILLHSNSYQLDLNLESNSVQLSRPNYDISFPKNLTPFNAEDDIQLTKDCQLQNNLESTAGSIPLLEGFCDHEDLLLEQLLISENLDKSWSKILLPHCARVANTLRPELCSTELMDIRNFVNFKKVPGGSRSESAIVGGVVFSKNVVHKDMATRIKNPRILLLQCAIVYQRVEGKFVRFETLMLQEKEYLRNVTARILSLNPNVVLVHKNVSGIAQDMLRKHGITLVLDVKSSVLDRLALNLQCDIVSSIDSNIGQPKLGVCDLFYIKNYDDGNGITKSLMFFETPSNPRGCCVLLRGGTTNELARVKKVASFLLFTRYNWRLELSFLLDEFARPPSPKPNLFDSKEQSPCNEYNFEENEENYQQISNNKLLKRSSAGPKKLEEKIINKENVQDFSDPLRAENSNVILEAEISSKVEFAVETPYDNRFRTALNSTILSISPNLTFPLPFLETEAGKKCILRSHFPNELYYSKHWSENLERSINLDSNLEKQNMKLLPVHEFVAHKIVTSIENRDLQTIVANFRANGGRLPKRIKMKILSKNNSNSINQQQNKKPIEEIIFKDALDIFNHQRLPVLFCSYYHSTKTASSFCAQPSLLNMQFYGQNDIMLGSFLERYCFRTSYICSSCNLPMLDHIRRYVHSNGCVLVALSEDPKKNDIAEIHLHSMCIVCRKTTKSVPMSKDTWCLSFAKYLELRFHGHSYKRRNIEEFENNLCEHSLHKDFIQYFTYNGIVASFEYTQIETWEIGLPSLMVQLKAPPLYNRNQLIDEIKNFAIKGYEVYAKIYEKLASLSSEPETSIMTQLKSVLNRDQIIFRSKVEKVHNVMTEQNISYYDINDSILLMKKALAESIETWGPKLQEVALQSQQLAAKKTETGLVCTEELMNSSESEERTFEKQISTESNDRKESIDSNENNPESRTSLTDGTLVGYVGGSSDKSKDVLDKKKIRSILGQLLPSTTTHNSTIPSPLPSFEYYTLPSGLFPVLVCDQDLSSIISYTLITHDYIKTLENMNSGYISDPNNSPHLKRKSQDLNLDDEINKEKNDPSGDKEKKTKSHSHIFVNFSDLTTQFQCKIYFAKEFDNLRLNFLRPTISENIDATATAASTSISEVLSSVQLDRKSSNNSLNTPINRLSEKSTQEIEEIHRNFVRSLSHSYHWEARGGKSGLNFSKTADDRFILKEMSKLDVNLFEKFAANYFEYVNQCLAMNQPTLLAKIFGVYSVTIKKKDSVIEKSILVMENLFCDREISNKFDLKGSERNRLVVPSNNQNGGEIVLLDENLIQMSWSKPLYILGHSRTILRQAITRDASFLEKNEVMDYSLLVGLNKNENLLVIGIIDYIRTFTFEKRIESMVKQSGLLGGQGKLPTIVSPKLYKQRFIEAMDRYFLIVPDRWEELGKK